MSFPLAVGSTRTETPTTLSQRVLDAMVLRYNKEGIALQYDISMDRSGKVWVDRVGKAPVDEVIIVVNKTIHPDELAEEIRFEARARAGR